MKCGRVVVIVVLVDLLVCLLAAGIAVAAAVHHNEPAQASQCDVLKMEAGFPVDYVMTGAGDLIDLECRNGGWYGDDRY